MRALSENIFYKHKEQVQISFIDEDATHIFDKTNIDSIVFKYNFAIINLENINETINSIAIIDTNANFIVAYIITEDDQERFYPIEITNVMTCINIVETNIKCVGVAFFSDDPTTCRYVTAGLAVDFPVHSKNKTHSISNTHAQYFSQTGHYFARYLPLKKFDTWALSFDFLTNKDKNKIIDFFESNEYSPFILQVWIEPALNFYTEDPIIYENNGFQLSVEASKNQNNKKYEMNAGLYVCTNETLDFKKNENDIYQWALTLNFREVK